MLKLSWYYGGLMDSGWNELIGIGTWPLRRLFSRSLHDGLLTKKIVFLDAMTPKNMKTYWAPNMPCPSTFKSSALCRNARNMFLSQRHEGVGIRVGTGVSERFVASRQTRPLGVETEACHSIIPTLYYTLFDSIISICGPRLVRWGP